LYCYIFKRTNKTPPFLKRYRHFGRIRRTPCFPRRTGWNHRWMAGLFLVERAQ